MGDRLHGSYQSAAPLFIQTVARAAEVLSPILGPVFTGSSTVLMETPALGVLPDSPRAARNSWQPGSLQSCTPMDTWTGDSGKSCSLSPDCSWTRT